MKQIKITQDSEGIIRKWLFDTDNKYIYYSGLAKDFQNNLFIVRHNTETAQEIIDNCGDYELDELDSKLNLGEGSEIP